MVVCVCVCVCVMRLYFAHYNGLHGSTMDNATRTVQVTDPLRLHVSGAINCIP